MEEREDKINRRIEVLRRTDWTGVMEVRSKEKRIIEEEDETKKKRGDKNGSKGKEEQGTKKEWTKELKMPWRI